MKHLVIDGCTVTITGLHEVRLAKLIRKLEPKPVRSWRVTAMHRGEHVSVDLHGPGMTQRSATAEALRIWAATLPWTINDTKPYPVHIREVVETT